MNAHRPVSSRPGAVSARVNSICSAFTSSGSFQSSSTFTPAIRPGHRSGLPRGESFLGVRGSFFAFSPLGVEVPSRTMPSADFRCAMGSPCGSLSPACTEHATDLPGLSWLSSTRNRRIYVTRFSNWRASGCVAPSPRAPRLISASLCDRPVYDPLAPLGSPHEDTVAFGLPSSLLNWDGTCPLDAHHPPVTISHRVLDRVLTFGTLARAHPQTAGPARHTTTPPTVQCPAWRSTAGQGGRSQTERGWEPMSESE